MKTIIRKIIPYLLSSLLVTGLWWFYTRTDNYAWNPKGKEPLMLDIALMSIFYYKTLFWLVIANLLVFIAGRLLRKDYTTGAVAAFAVILFYSFAGPVVDKKCAFHYYTVFHNQSVSEEYIDRPIINAGYQIGPIVTGHISDPQMKYRRYAIAALEHVKYKPAIPALTKILFDKKEPIEFRAEALRALNAFNTDLTTAIVLNFKRQVGDSADKKVPELAGSWMR